MRTIEVEVPVEDSPRAWLTIPVCADYYELPDLFFFLALPH
jgi:hypothetical protein